MKATVALVLFGMLAVVASASDEGLLDDGFFDGSDLEDLADMDDSHEDSWDDLDSDLDEFGSILDSTHGYDNVESYSEESIETEDDANQAILETAKEENELADVLSASEALETDTDGNAQAVMSHLQTSSNCNAGPSLGQGTVAFGLAIQLWNAGHFRNEFPDSEDFQQWVKSEHKGGKKTKVCKELAQGIKLLKKQEKKAGGTAQPIPIKMAGKVPGTNAAFPPAYVIPYPVAHPMPAPAKPVIKKAIKKVHKKVKKLCKKAKKVIKKVPKCQKKKLKAVKCMKKKITKCEKKKPKCAKKAKCSKAPKCAKKVVHKCKKVAPLCKKPAKKALSPCVKKLHACHKHAHKVLKQCGKMSKAWMLKKRAQIHKMLASFHECWSRGIHSAVGRCPPGYVVNNGACVRGQPQETELLVTSKLCTNPHPCRRNAVRTHKSGCKCVCSPGFRAHKGGCHKITE